MEAHLKATVVYAQPERQWVVDVELEPGASIQEAVERSGLLRLCPELAGTTLELGIFHRRRAAATLVRDGDRIEIYRPLQIDPKQARRLRVAGTKGRRNTSGGNGP